jgi:hypothetical protein
MPPKFDPSEIKIGELLRLSLQSLKHSTISLSSVEDFFLSVAVDG